MRRPDCHSCGRGGARVVLKKNITQNGALQIAWYCKGCDAWAMQGWLAHEDVRRYLARWNYEIEDIPVRNDYRDHECEICGEKEGEWHHFAPQSLSEIFGKEWVRWPEIFLCKKHHRQWHQAVTWYMPTYGNTQIAKMAREKWMNEAEHVENAKDVFRAWFEKAAPHMSPDDRQFAETVLEEASTFKETLVFVDIIANAYDKALSQHEAQGV